MFGTEPSVWSLHVSPHVSRGEESLHVVVERGVQTGVPLCVRLAQGGEVGDTSAGFIRSHSGVLMG